MPERVQHITERRGIDGNFSRVTRTAEADDLQQEAAESQTKSNQRSIAARLIWYIAGILLVLLGFRFVFALLGANPDNTFAHFIYTASHPFVAPFFSLFSYNLHYGVSRFEAFTLVAMAVYALVAYGLGRLLTIDRPATASRA